MSTPKSEWGCTKACNIISNQILIHQIAFTYIVSFTPSGQDYDRMKVLDIQADEAERMAHKKKKPNTDTGFSSKMVFLD